MSVLLLIIVVVLMILLGYSLTRIWINPAFILILYWAFFILASLYAFRNKYIWNLSGLFWITLACILFMVGYIIGGSILTKRSKVLSTIKLFNRESHKLSNLSWNCIILFILFGMTRVIIEVAINGFSLSMFFDLDSLINMNTSMAYDRYNGGGNTTNTAMQILSFFVYAAPLCGGYSFIYAETKVQKFLSFATLIPIVCSLLITNGKVGLISNVFLWVSGFFISYIEKNRKAPSIKKGKIVKISLVLISVFGLLYFSMLLRIGDLSSRTRAIVNEKFMSYAFGQMPVFDSWFSNYRMELDYTIGQNTFLAIYKVLGFAERQQGVYGTINGFNSNIFTGFRGMIEDFGTIGGLIFFMILGGISGYFFNCLLLKQRVSVMSKVCLASIYFFVFFSIFISPWTYTSYIMVFPIFAFYLWSTKYKIIFSNL